MKVSVSLSSEDIEFVDKQTERGLFKSRSATIQAAVRLLREREYVDSYAAAWDEWDSSGDDVMWDKAVADGIR